MGTSVSRHEDLAVNEYLIRFVSKEHIKPSDPFWNRFLAFNIRPPITSQEQLTLDSRIEPLCQQLLSNNLKSGNFGALIDVFLIRSSELLASAHTDNHMFAWQTFNALFIIRCVIKYLIETLSEEQVIDHFEVLQVESVLRVEYFLNSLIELIVDVPLKDFTYPVHLEAVNCMLVILSVQLFSNQRADRSVVYRIVMLGRAAIHASVLTRTLLQHFIEQQRAPPNLYGDEGGGSLVLGIAAELWSMLTFGASKRPLESPVLSEGAIVHTDTPLANQVLLLVLVLTNHCTTQPNPYRQSLFGCLDSQDNTAVKPSQVVTLFKIDYSALYTTLCKVVCNDPATLLLYLVLHRNQHFKDYIMKRPDIELLVIPILRTLYHAPESNSHHIYMSLIILLILSEDDTFNKSIHEIKLKTVPWYTERAISEITLGGLLVLVVIRTIQYNMLKMRDKYLHTNCLAALANMSGQFRRLHPYVAQRLVSLFETLAKKHQRLQERLRAESRRAEQTGLDSENDGRDSVDPNEIAQDLTVLEEVLRMVLEIFNSTLSNQLSNNPNLVYTLLYKKHIFEPFRQSSAFQDVVQNIDAVISYFTQKLEVVSESHNLDVKEVLSTITQGAKTWPKEKLKKFPDLKFKYVEEDQPEEFFIPYVWSLVCRNSLVHWSSENVKLFNSNNDSSNALVC